jgi:hypothetical protein
MTTYIEPTAEHRRPLWAAVGIVGTLAFLFLLVDFIGGTSTPDPGYEIVGTSRHVTFFTHRDKPCVHIRTTGRYVSLTGLFNFATSGTATRLEIPKDAVDQLKPGDRVTYDQLQLVRGRSIAGHAADFLLKNR